MGRCVARQAREGLAAHLLGIAVDAVDVSEGALLGRSGSAPSRRRQRPPGAGRSDEFNLQDLVALAPAGRRHLDGVAHGLTDQCPRDRRGD